MGVLTAQAALRAAPDDSRLLFSLKRAEKVQEGGEGAAEAKAAVQF